MTYRFTLYLPPFILLLLHETDGRKDAFDAIGSSVLLDPEGGADLDNSEVLWEFTGSDGKLVPILDYVPGYPQEEPNKNFESRLLFITSNGSLMLNNSQRSDQGVYTITVDRSWKRSIILELFEPLSEPFINVTFAHATIKLMCQVSAGKVSSIRWQKDEKMITNTERYQLVQNNSVLIISGAMLSDYGTYICTLENPVSQKNVSCPLAIYGLHFYALPFFITALVTAIVVLLLKIAFFLKANSSCKLFENLLQIVQHLPVITILGYWIWLEGPDKTMAFVLAFFCLLAVSSVFLICNRLITTLKVNSHFLKLMDTIATAGTFSVLCTSALLFVKPKLQADNECEPVDNLQTNLIFAAVVPFTLVFIFLAGCIMYRKWQTQRTQIPTSNSTVNEAVNHECIELMVKSCPESGIPVAEIV